MGPKITIDSATMMNKGLELIEAHHLFALPPAEIDVLVHPQSIVHGLVEFRDGSVIAQLGSPDMRIPIAHCLAWPDRIDGPAARLDLAAIGSLTFEAPDPTASRRSALARQALEAGGAAPDRAQCGQRGRGRRLHRPQDRLCRDRGTGRGDARRRRAAQRHAPSRRIIDEALAVDHIARSLAHDLLPEIAAKAS